MVEATMGYQCHGRGGRTRIRCRRLVKREEATKELKGDGIVVKGESSLL